jgi:hypothetical protein
MGIGIEKSSDFPVRGLVLADVMQPLQYLAPKPTCADDQQPFHGIMRPVYCAV